MALGRCLLLGLGLVLSLALSACAPKRVLRQPTPATEPGPAPRGDPAPGGDRVPDRTVRPSTPDDPVPRAIQAAEIAASQLGKPYRWGGHSPERGFDCSGLVMWSFGCVGVDLPRVVSAQRQAGRNVHGGAVLPGDLVFFAIDGGRASHVGIVVDDERFIHAPRTGRPVRLDELDDPYWRPRWVATRRITRN